MMLEFYAPAEPQANKTAVMNLSDSEFYDTDIEPDNHAPKKESVKATQSMACLLYTKECEKTQQRVQNLVIKQLSEETVNIHHSNITSQGIIAVAHALKNNLTVTELNLTDNAINGDGACYLADCLVQNKTIEKLNLSHNDFGRKGAIVIGEMLKHNTAIKTIDLSHNKFEENDGQYLAAGLEWNDRLKEIDLSHNNLSQDGAGFIGIAIGKNDSIVKLNISWNHIRRSGAVSFCKPLRRNYTLTHLNVSWNGFGFEGALGLGKLIQSNKTLKHIDASYNHINWKGATLIGEGLRNSKTLDIIKLGGNPLTTTGCMDIIDNVSKKTCSLQTLDLTGVPVIGEFEMMASAVQQTRSFSYIHGGIVGTHDVLGQRLEKKVDPMQRVIDYMRERELRPTELFRSFDKAVGNKLSHRDFIDRIKKAGIPIPKHEYEELIHQIECSNGIEEPGNITYSKMVEGVKEQIEKERIDRIKKREKEKKYRKRNKEILDSELPAIRDENSDLLDDDKNSLGRQTSFMKNSQGRNSASLFRGPTASMSSMGMYAASSSLSSGPGTIIMANLNKQYAKQPQKLISMAADLDGPKEKSKKKKKKKSKRKK